MIRHDAPVRRLEIAGDVARGLGAVAVLAGLVAGLPWALLRWGRWPITGMPTWDQITDLPTTLVADETVLAIFTVALWLCWAVFVVAVGAEAVIHARGRRRGALPVPSAFQLLAGHLVGAVVVSLGSFGAPSLPTAYATSGGTGAPGGALRTPVAPRSAVTLVDDRPVDTSTPALFRGVPEPEMLAEVGNPGGGTLAPGGPVESPPADVTITVGRGDSPWMLAETHLGDGKRWRELWELNRDRRQPDGGVWANPGEAIRPGWRLAVPGAPGGTTPGPGARDATATPETVTVEPGDHLWGLAEEQLTETWDRAPTDDEIAPYWAETVDANRDQLAPPRDPDEIRPGERFVLPATPVDPLAPPPASPPPDPGPQPGAGAPVPETPADEAPAVPETPADEAPAVPETPADEAPAVPETPADEAPAVPETPADEAPAVPETPADEAPAVPETPADEAPAVPETLADEAPAPETPADEAPAVPETPADETPSAGVPGAPAPRAEPPAVSTPRTSADDPGTAPAGEVGEDEGERLPIGLVGGGLALAGLVLLLDRRRRAQLRHRRAGRRVAMPDAALADAERELRAGADTDGARLVDGALRAVAAGAGVGGPPELRWVEVTDDHVTLVLASRSAVPPPTGFEAENPTRWRTVAPVDELAALGAAAASPAPALVPVGTTVTGAEVLVDLEASGVVTVAGSPERVVPFLRSVAVAAATAPWTEQPRVLMVGMSGELTALAWVERAESLGVALVDAENRSAEAIGALRALQCRTTAMARAAGATPDAWEPLVVVSTRAPDDERFRVAALAARPGHAVGVVCPPGEVPHGRPLVIDDDGWLHIDGVDPSIRARQLDEHDTQAVADLLDVAGDRDDVPVDEAVEPGVRTPAPPSAGSGAAVDAGADDRTGEADADDGDGAGAPDGPSGGGGESFDLEAFGAGAAGADVPEVADAPDVAGVGDAPAGTPDVAAPAARRRSPVVDAGTFAEPAGAASPGEYGADGERLAGRSASWAARAARAASAALSGLRTAGDDETDRAAGSLHRPGIARPGTGDGPAAGASGGARAATPSSGDVGTTPPAAPGDSTTDDDATADTAAAAGPPESAAQPATEPTSPLVELLAETDVVIRVLGDVEAVRRRPEGEEHLVPGRQKALEALTYLALREMPVDREDLEIVLFPTGANATKTFHNTVAAARRTLGDDLFPAPSGGRYELSSRVVTDYGLFHELVAIAEDVEDAEDAADVLAEALTLVGGEPFVGAGRGYGWVAPHRGMIVAQVVDVAEELAEVRLATDDWRAAEWAARQGLRAFPCDERMYRLLMRAAHAAGNMPGVQRVFRELCDAVADPDEGAEPEDTVHPETVALLERLTGGGGGRGLASA